MIIEEPNNSKIKINRDNGNPCVIMPNGTSGILKYFISAFLICWLGGWAVGWVTTAKTLLSGETGANWFLIFWLCGWTVGGFFAFGFLYRILRPSIPESLELKTNSVVYDSGIPPYKFSFGFVGLSEQWNQFFPKKIKVELSKNALQSLKLREHLNGNRLTVDNNGERIDLAKNSSEIDREWLYKLLKEKYC